MSKVKKFKPLVQFKTFEELMRYITATNNVIYLDNKRKHSISFDVVPNVCVIVYTIPSDCMIRIKEDIPIDILSTLRCNSRIIDTGIYELHTDVFYNIFYNLLTAERLFYSIE